jgi:hypothetical protein
MEYCRAINGATRRQCNSTPGWKLENGKKKNRNMTEVCKSNGCRLNYFQVMKSLQYMEKKGLIQSEKRRWWDRNTSGKRTDLFRFWYINRELYEEIILMQTLDGWLVS